MFFANKNNPQNIFRKSCQAIFSLLMLILLSACAEPESRSETPQVVERESHHTIMLDVLVSEEGKALEVKLSEGQKNMGIFSKNAIRQAYKKTYPTKKVDGKNIQYWLKNVEAPSASVSTS